MNLMLRVTFEDAWGGHVIYEYRLKMKVKTWDENFNRAIDIISDSGI